MSSNRVENRKAQISAAIKTLKESSNLQEKCRALTCIQSISSKTGTPDVPTESQLREICKLVINAFASGNKVLHPEASATLVAILRSYKDRELNLCNELIQINFEHRLRIFQLFEELEDDTILAVSRDAVIVDFLKDCMSQINPGKMEWLAPNACTDNVKALKIAEYKSLNPAEQIEEKVTICILELLCRLYKLSRSPAYAECAKFSTLFMDKIATLAYMGHKRQRGPAIKVLQLPNMGNHIRSNSAAIWQSYKTTLQNTYCRRMAVLVTACEPDWSLLWTASIQILGTELHRGAGLINNLLSVEEKAFKSVDTIVRRQAFLSWKLIVDNFALDEQELATARRVKLLCIPLNAKNSKTELMTLTKLEVWWHLIYKLYNHIGRFANTVLIQFLNFSFGPLGDTPLLSSNCNVIASPGKRFSNTKLVAIDALLQLLTNNHEDLKVVRSSLEERIPECVSLEIFQECFKPFAHSVGEACLAIAQLSSKEVEARIQIIAILWRTLLARVEEVRDEAAKVQMYKEIMLLVLELSVHSETQSIIANSMMEIILPSLDEFPANYIFHFETIVGLMTILTKPAILCNISNKHHDLLKRLLYRGVRRPDATAPYVPNALEVFKRLVIKLEASQPETNIGASVLWYVLCEMITKYMMDGNKMNEGDAAAHNFTTVKTLIKFPFTARFAPDFWQFKRSAVVWRALYKQFNHQASQVPTVEPNEYVFFAIAVIQDGIKLEKRCSGLAVTCLDGILITMNYNHMLGENRFLPILKLINDLCILNLTTKGQHKEAETALRELSSVLITLYGTAPNIVASCLEVVRPAIEEMLKPYEEKGLVREIASTWETIMTIFKGLGEFLSPELIISFKDAIKLASHHQDSEIVAQTLSCPETEKHMTGPTKNAVQALLKEINTKKVTKESTDSTEAAPGTGQKQTKPIKLVGSFLNWRSNASPKPVTSTQKPRDDKKSPFFPDPESQEYVVIQSEFKFDAKRLTEHQKESLLRRREDIPALYNDLSQSCSQDTQNIQEWFDKKKTEINKTSLSTKLAAPTGPPNTQNVEIIGGANKENKLESEETLGANKDEEKLDKESEMTKASDNKEVVKKTATEKPSLGNSSTDLSFSPTVDVDTRIDSNKLVAKKLNFESRTEFPDVALSAQKSTEKPSTSKSVEVAEDKAIKKTAKSNKGDGETIQETKRGVKRKATAVSDSDSEGNMPPGRRRRKSNLASNLTEQQSDSDSVKSTESERANKPLSKATKNEMSRLQINMVFDNKQFSTLPSRRRSKIQYEDENDTTSNDQDSPEPGKLTKNKVSKNTPQDSSKAVRVKVVIKEREKEKVKEKEKEAKNTPVVRIGKKRGRKPKNPVQEEQPIKITVTVKSPSPVSGSSGEKAPIDTLSDQKVGKTKLQESPEVKEKKESIEASKELVSEAKDVSENSPEQLTATQNFDSEEIIESSQASSVGSNSLDKKYNNKQCFIRINKIKNVSPGQGSEIDAGKDVKKITKNMTPDSPSKVSEYVFEDDDPMIGRPATEDEPTVLSSNSGKEAEETQSGAATTRTSEIEMEDVPAAIIEATNSSPESRLPPVDATSSPIRLPTSLLNSSSPKNSLKRFSKLKSVPTQGRAAHMLGLVTKQAIAETRSNAFLEGDMSPGKKKTKEVDDESSTGKRERLYALKEPERLGSPSGSRQEKIFNKMRISNDTEGSLTVSNLFGNLKNDGEKSSSGNNLEKERNVLEIILTTAQTEKTKEKNDADNTSPTTEKEPLAMLEWSSANPPSLTASPSASILKRQRLIQIENDPESPTTCKRKRVSFADPPVSKEMGYEIPVTTPTHRMAKIAASKIFLPRKDTPVRLKQTKFKLVQSPAKTDRETEIEVDKSVMNDTESQANRTANENSDVESKIVEADSDSPVVILSETLNQSNDRTETLSRENDSAKVRIHNLTMEIEIASRSPTRKLKDKDKKYVKELNEMNKPKTDETDTQQDIFDNISIEDNNKSSKNHSKRGEKSGGRGSPIENNVKSRDINLFTSNTSVEVNNLVRSQSSIETLEDTVDIQNVTSLNSTSNSDEMFCSRPVRTSTQSTEADTLPVTDSVFSNLPFSQNSQANNDTMELDQPELLDSTRSIFPSLADSSVPIDSVIGHLADPVWKPHLSSYLRSKGIETVGNLAQLTEREVNWIPVKRSPKIPFVRNVLQHFEKSIPSLPSTISVTDPEQESVTITPNASLSSFPSSSTPIAQSSSLSNPQEQTHDLINNERKNESTETQAMKNMVEEDLECVATIKMPGIASKNQTNEHLKSACRASGLTKVLESLPEIFGHDKQFFEKVLTTYRHKLQVSDYVKGFDIEEVEKAVAQRYTSSTLAEMLTKKLKEEEESGATTPMTELSALHQAMLKRMPNDLLISHTVANEELISPLVVLDLKNIALKNNTPGDISSALDEPNNARNQIFGNLCTIEALSTKINDSNLSDDALVKMLEAISKKLDARKLLHAFYVTMNGKLVQQESTASKNT